MKLIESKVELIEQQPGLEGMYKQIELAGRTCYKSEDKITEDSTKEFVDRMIKLGHGAMLEHGTVYLLIPINQTTIETRAFYCESKYTKCKTAYTDNTYTTLVVFVTTNLRVLVEANRLEDLQFICEPTEHHEKRITARFTCDRGVSHEIVRHRVMSFAQESTRYCNYSKDKFNNEITFIIPTWANIPEGEYTYWDGDWCNVGELTILKPIENDMTDHFLFLCDYAEKSYDLMIGSGAKPQEARQVLPNATKTEIVVTGFESDWKHFLKLRTAGAAHPDMRKLAVELKELMYGKEV